MNADKLLEVSRTRSVHRFSLTDIISLTVIPTFVLQFFYFLSFGVPQFLILIISRV